MLNLYAGTDKTFTIQIYLNGTPLDLTGLVAAKFCVKENVDDSDSAALITKTLGAGLLVSAPPTSGIMTLSFVVADSVNRPSQTVTCSLKVTDITNLTSLVFSDSFSIIRTAVRSI
jgi:hypothetical protein